MSVKHAVYWTTRFSVTIGLLLALSSTSSSLMGQTDCVTYQYVPQTVYETVPTTRSQWVNETVYETRQVTTYKPVWQTETRERKTTVLKPVYKTSEREEKYIVRRPVIETTYEEREVRETTYETVTEMQEQRYLVEKPVIETEYREEQVVVRKPVTERMLKTENITTYKPVNVMETAYVPSVAVNNDWVWNPDAGRARLRRVSPGYYLDPTTGQMVYSARRLAWVRPGEYQMQSTLVPAVTPQVVNRTTYIPETVQRQTPVEMTTYKETVETRKVPVQVQKTTQSIEVRQVPVTVQKPVVKIRTEKVPVEKVTYRDEERVRKIPVNEVTYERVEKIEPYEVSTCQWVAETREVRVPKTVTRRVDYQVNETVARTIMKRVAVDAWGNIVSEPSSQTVVTSSSTYNQPENPSSTVVRRVELPETTQSEEKPPTVYYGKPIYVDPQGKETSESTTASQSVLSTSSEEKAGPTKTEMAPVTSKAEPANDADQANDEAAADPSKADADSNEPTQASQEADLDQKPKAEAADNPPRLDEQPKKDNP
ncbi:MAG: hypothetical protein MK108_11720 [Mariniblastus sp.]|nr:hypothetical protein [Mariniblastus sp.]